MADTDETKEQEKQEDSEQEKREGSKAEKSGEKSSRGRFLQWIVMAVVVVLFIGAGFGVSRLVTGSGTTETAEASEQDQPVQEEHLTAAGSLKTRYYQ